MSIPQPTLCLFEDQTASNFDPLVFARPVFDLRCGTQTLREKILSFFPDVPYRLWCRDELKSVVEEHNPGTPVNTVSEGVTLYINGRVLMDDMLARILSVEGPDRVFLKGETLVAARMRDSRWPMLLSESGAAPVVRESMEREEVHADMATYAWDLIRMNGDEIRRDHKKIGGQPVNTPEFPGTDFINAQDITVYPDAMILPGSVIDASDGPVIIGEGVRILPHSYLQGPVSIGAESIVQAGACIYGGTSIGPVCKVGGEVASSIIHGYSNKQHHGFLGHAYLGQWVNLGAGTTNSNLKNTYGTISMWLNGQMVDTGMLFLGILMGDFGKSGISTTFNTGTVMGFSANVVSVEILPKYIPSFCWHGPEGMADYEITKALEVAQRMMARRNIPMGPLEQDRFVKVFGETERDRARAFDLAI